MSHQTEVKVSLCPVSILKTSRSVMYSAFMNFRSVWVYILVICYWRVQRGLVIPPGVASDRLLMVALMGLK